MTQFGLQFKSQLTTASPEKQVLTGQEAVQLHQQLEIDIVALRRLAVRAADVMSVEIDTYSEKLAISL